MGYSDWRFGFPSGIEEADELDKSVARVAKMTDENMHNGARLFIAQYMGSKKYMNIFKLIAQLHKEIGHMPQGLIKFRDEMTNEMLSGLEQARGKEIRDKFYSAL